MDHVRNDTMDQLADSLQNLLTSGSFGGSFLALFLAYLGGILSSLTPCIYPMIPITIGVVGGIQTHHEERNPRGILMRGIAYVLGMAIIYAFLGVLAGITGQVFGSFTNTSNWYLGLSLFMSLAALMMLDILPFDPQAWLADILSRIASHPAHRLDDLLPWNWLAKRPASDAKAA